MLGGLVPVSLPFQFPSLLNFNPPGPGVPGCSMGASSATNSGYTLAQSECVHEHSSSRAWIVFSCVYVTWLVWVFSVSLISFFNFFLFLHFTSCFGASFLPSHLLLDCCALFHLSFHLSCHPPDLFKSLQPGSQVALPPHLQLAFSGKRCRNLQLTAAVS